MTRSCVRRTPVRSFQASVFDWTRTAVSSRASQDVLRAPGLLTASLSIRRKIAVSIIIIVIIIIVIKCHVRRQVDPSTAAQLIDRAEMSERRVYLCAAVSVNGEVWEAMSKAGACCPSYIIFSSESLFCRSSSQNEKVHKHKKFE